jgi:hypothetical protein
MDAAGLDRYDELLMQGLYKRLSQIDSSYFLDDNAGGGGDFRASRDDGEAGMGAAIRDSEYIQHSSNAGSDGFIHMSGGAGEGQQHLMPDGSVDNIKEGVAAVKSDESLPFYCHPPNPCPKGFTSDDGCQTDIEDTAEAQKTWISSMEAHGYCSCDREHMFDCPDVQLAAPGGEGIKSSSRGQAFSDVVDGIFNDKAAATYMSGEKRQTLVAKKSPRVKRGVSSSNMEAELKRVSQNSELKRNPYLSGEPLRTAAKKG